MELLDAHLTRKHSTSRQGFLQELPGYRVLEASEGIWVFGVYDTDFGFLLR